MNATAHPIWEIRENGSFTLRLSSDVSFGGSVEGSTYYVSLPGQGIRKCWNRAQVECVCRDYAEQLEAEADIDDAPVGPSPDSLLRQLHERVL